MIAKIIEWSSRNRFFVFLGTGCAIAAGLYALIHTPLDAIPDLSDTQVIVFTEWPGRSPDIIEDQITYPIVSKMIAAPKVQDVRAYSMFGMSFVYIIFDEGTDLYWARSRTLEYLSTVTGQLPEGVQPTLGPDATGVGWVYEYVLVDRTGKRSLADLRSFQDWSLRYQLASIPGVAEVAAVGGFVNQYQVEVDPVKLAALKIPLKDVVMQIQNSNNDVGGRILEMQGKEFYVRGRGYIQSLEDIESVPVGEGKNGVPILVRDVARVQRGPDIRRGAAEWNGEGEVVGGIVVMRSGENAHAVIQRVKEKIEEIRPSLPEGVELITAYDRSTLIGRSIETLSHKLLEEMLIVGLVIIIFLWHFKSALIPIVTLPIAVLCAFIPMKLMGLTSNIMSLGGIAIAIGAMVDAAVIFVENAHKHLETWDREGRREDRATVLLHACQEVGRPLFFSLLIIAVSFMPVFSLEAQEGRLFKPLAFTKNFSMIFAAILAITLVPALMQWLLKDDRKKILHEDEHPISKKLFQWYEPILRWMLARRKKTIMAAVLVVLTSIPVYWSLGTEFMPPLNEGDILYMPTTLPGISIEEAKRWLQTQDQIIRQFPEVKSVFGKIGRAETPTDPAPLSMVETVIQLKSMHEWPKVVERRFWFDRRRTWEELIAALDTAVKLPGTTNAWVMPIKTRIDMLTTGIRTPIGIKIFGPDLSEIQKIGEQIEGALPVLTGTRSAYAERSTGGSFVDIRVKREQAARYGLTVGDVEDVIETAIGGENITTTVEGRARFPVNVRYARLYRDDPEELGRVLVATPHGAQITLAQVADITLTSGPPMIKDENGLLTDWVYVDVKEGTDLAGYVKRAKRLVAEKIQLPAGYYLEWSGQYQYIERAAARLRIVIPLTLFIIFLLLYFNTRSVPRTLIVLLAVPFSIVGAVWLLWFLDYQMSVAVWVGILALAGVDAETGVVMLLYLDLSYDAAVRSGKMRSLGDLEEAAIHGAVKRVRPKLMTVACLFMGLLPIMWASTSSAGADVMKRIAAPMVGGIFTSFLMELLIYPCIYVAWRRREIQKENH